MQRAHRERERGTVVGEARVPRCRTRSEDLAPTRHRTRAYDRARRYGRSYDDTVSIPVDLAALRAQIQRFGSNAILVTTSDDGPPHVSSVVVTFAGDDLAMGAGRRTRANVAQHPDVALVWTAEIDPDYCLIVDAVVDEPPGESLIVRPTAAVLHRLASAPGEIPQCRPLEP